jgi:hypothetical protein
MIATCTSIRANRDNSRDTFGCRYGCSGTVLRGQSYCQLIVACATNRRFDLASVPSAGKAKARFAPDRDVELLCRRLSTDGLYGFPGDGRC